MWEDTPAARPSFWSRLCPLAPEGPGRSHSAAGQLTSPSVQRGHRFLLRLTRRQLREVVCVWRSAREQEPLLTEGWAHTSTGASRASVYYLTQSTQRPSGRDNSQPTDEENKA